MVRGSKEFYEVQESFEKALRLGVFGYLPNNFEKDDFGKNTFYANGEVNKAFLTYMAGYSAGRLEYMNA